MKNKYFNFAIILLFFIGIFIVLNHPFKGTEPTQPIEPIESSHIPANIKSVQLGGQNVQVDLALTTATQEQGLSGRTSLAPNTGMLFVFPTPNKYLFWMKDMNFPIDMIWLAPSVGGDDDAKVVYIAKDATPASYPSTFGPGANDQDALYVIEVPSGFADANNLKVGDSVLFTY